MDFRMMNEERPKRAEEQRRGANKRWRAHTILACDDHASWHACKQCGGERRGGDVTGDDLTFCQESGRQGGLLQWREADSFGSFGDKK